MHSPPTLQPGRGPALGNPPDFEAFGAIARAQRAAARHLGTRTGVMGTLRTTPRCDVLSRRDRTRASR